MWRAFLRHCAQTNKGNASGIYTTLEGVAGFDEYKQELAYADQKKTQTEPTSSGNKKVIYIDEFGLVQSFSAEQRQKLYDYLQSEKNEQRVCWVIACNAELSKNELARLKPNI